MTLTMERSALTDTTAPRRTYVGKITGAGDRFVRVLDESGTGSFSRPLRPRPNGHSTEFNWGYGGSGPAETAHAILADYLEVDPTPALYQRFKFEVVANWPQNQGWTLPGHAIEAWLGGLGDDLPRDRWADRPLE